MKIKSAEFVKSSPKLDDCPSPIHPEYAFIGRSNVGKSSLLNMLTGKKNLAKTSGTPGKTQYMNYFKVNANLFLVDLPGYGYAKRSKKDRKKWDQNLRNYLKNRKNLIGVFVLIDINVPPQENDLNFMEWLGVKGIPFAMTFTKSDKLNSSKLNRHLLNYKKEMLKQWEEMPEFFITSAESKLGKKELLKFIEQSSKSFIKQ